jgi:hypothetical protein
MYQTLLGGAGDFECSTYWQSGCLDLDRLPECLGNRCLCRTCLAVYQGWRWLVAGVAGIAGTILVAAFGPSPVQQWLRAVPAFFGRG